LKLNEEISFIQDFYDLLLIEEKKAKIPCQLSVSNDYTSQVYVLSRFLFFLVISQDSFSIPSIQYSTVKCINSFLSFIEFFLFDLRQSKRSISKPIKLEAKEHSIYQML
jgi:hypothetical protein